MRSMNVGSIRQEADAAGPISPGDRVWAIDALRGFALFGVLAINLDTEFRRTLFEQFQVRSEEGGLDRIASLLLAYGLETKAISLFSLLFGVSLTLQYDSLRRKDMGAPWLVRRLLVLLAFGLVHLFLIWNGDILTEYALAGLLVVPFLFLHNRFSLLVASLLLILFAALPLFNLGSIVPPAAQMNAHIADARQAYSHGSLIDVTRFRISEVALLVPLLAYVFPRTLALMLFGSWLWRSGAIARMSERRVGLTIGGMSAALVGFITTAHLRGDISVVGFGRATALVAGAAAPLLIACGYACLILAGSGSRTFRAAFNWAADVGRMAFSNYIAQSLILSIMFYGIGFGLMGKVGAATGLAFAVVLFAIQSWTSSAWLRTYRFGPLEWIWRFLTYGRRPQWRIGRS